MPTTTETKSTGIYKVTTVKTVVNTPLDWREAKAALVASAAAFDFSDTGFAKAISEYERSLLAILQTCGAIICNHALKRRPPKGYETCYYGFVPQTIDPRNVTMFKRAESALGDVRELRGAVSAGNTIAAATIAIRFGRKLEMVNVTDFEPEAVIGSKVRRGGKRGAIGTNPSPADIAALSIEAKRLYRKQYLEPIDLGETLKKTEVVKRIAKAIGKSPRSVHTYLK